MAVRAGSADGPVCGPKVAMVADRIRDERGGRVVFVSHCLLNENVRYLGGATRPRAVGEFVQRYIAEGVGLCQTPCPEQQAWGGVLKPRMVRLYGAPALRHGLLRAGRSVATRAWMHAVYRRFARRVVADIADYSHSGMEIVGVAASPSCGVTTTLNRDGRRPVRGLTPRLRPSHHQCRSSRIVDRRAGVGHPLDSGDTPRP